MASHYTSRVVGQKHVVKFHNPAVCLVPFGHGNNHAILGHIDGLADPC